MQQVLLLVKQRLQPLAKAAFEQLGEIVEKGFESRDATADVLQRLQFEVPVHAGTLQRFRPGRQPRSGRRGFRCWQTELRAVRAWGRPV